MDNSKESPDTCCQELDNLSFILRMRDYSNMIKWLLIVNLVAWSAVAGIIIQSWSV